MTFKTLLIMNAVMAFLTGIACVLVPAPLLATYGITLIPMGFIIYQLWGALLIGLGVLSWLVRNTTELELQKAVALSLFVTYGISGGLAIRGQFSGANSLGWSTVAVFAVFALGFGYFRFIKLQTS